MFIVTFNDISFIYATVHRCADGLKKKSGFHAIDISVAFYDALIITCNNIFCRFHALKCLLCGDMRKFIHRHQAERHILFIKVCRQSRKTFLLLYCLFFLISFLFYFFPTICVLRFLCHFSSDLSHIWPVGR